MGDSLDIVNNDLSAMKLDGNLEEKFIQPKEIYEKYKKEIENLKITIENKDKELKEINEDYEILKIQVKVQVKKIKKILPDSKSVTVKNIKREVQLFQDLAEFGPYDVKTKFRTILTIYANNTKMGEEFDGKRFPYRYQLEFHKDGDLRRIYLHMKVGDHDEHLKWPFEGTVRVIVCEERDKTWKLTNHKECKIDRPPSVSNEIYWYQPDTKKNEDVVIKCWIFPGCKPQRSQSAS